MAQLPREVSTIDDARDVLRAIARLTAVDAPILAQLAHSALASESVADCEPSIVLLYTLGLEQDQPYVADLADELLCWLERQLVLAG